MRKPGLRKLLGITVGFLTVIFLIAYYLLGGFSPVTLELVQVNNYKLAGRYFEGSYRSDTIRIYFNEMKTLLQQGQLDGYPVIIYDQEPDGVRGLSKSFVGIELSDSLALPVNLEKREMRATQVIRVSKNAHISVMPGPNSINKRITRYCQEHNISPVGPSIEIYHPDNRLVIEQPVRANN